MFLIVFWTEEDLENDPEVRGVILTKFGPKRSHLDPVQVNFYSFWSIIFSNTSPNVNLYFLKSLLYPTFWPQHLSRLLRPAELV